MTSSDTWRETLSSTEFRVGLSSWIIADGNYEHFKRGDRASFALEFSPTNSPVDLPSAWFSVDPPNTDQASIHHVEGSEYVAAARVTHVFDDWWVIDAGIPMYRASSAPDGVKEGSWVSGKIYVGVDPFFYFERLSRHHTAPALIYDWNVATIKLETTQVIQSHRMITRDRSRRTWQEVNDTKAHMTGALVDEFVLGCVRVDAPPRR